MKDQHETQADIPRHDQVECRANSSPPSHRVRLKEVAYAGMIAANAYLAISGKVPMLDNVGWEIEDNPIVRVSAALGLARYGFKLGKENRKDLGGGIA